MDCICVIHLIEFLVLNHKNLSNTFKDITLLIAQVKLIMIAQVKLIMQRVLCVSKSCV
uniref:Uncharacterized protein n=1 Tax=Oryza glumipatula TaxID=40148 RepID=A0A0E0BRS8_9ORYZ